MTATALILFTGVTRDMRIATEEIFGPVFLAVWEQPGDAHPQHRGGTRWREGTRPLPPSPCSGADVHVAVR
jgi:hypothetical protein